MVLSDSAQVLLEHVENGGTDVSGTQNEKNNREIIYLILDIIQIWNI